jgi:predicted permease
MNLAQVLMDVLLPIFIIFGIGYVLGKKKNPEPRQIAHMSIYILLPSLVFASFVEKDILSSLAVTGVYVLLFTCIMYVLSAIVCKIVKFDKKLESGFLLSVLFTNSGNYGVPLCTFAFGVEGTANALAYMMYSSIIIYTMAVFVASRGALSVKESVTNIFRIPLIYAVVIASVFSYYHVDIPSFIQSPLSLLGSAAIPVCMILLGIQLSRTNMHTAYKPLVLSNVLRLCVSPFVGIVLTSVMGVEGLLRSILIIESSMPTAVNSALIAIEFDAEPGLVSSALLISTVLSIGSLAVLLLYLT